MKYVSDTEAGKHISAWVVVKNGELIAKVNAHYGTSTVTVDVFNYGKPDEEDAHQQGKASGYGYDKLTAALAGLVIDGITLANHCAQTDETRTMLADYHAGTLIEPEKWVRSAYGFEFANMRDGKYQSLYVISGLGRLKALGYQVYQAI